MKQVVLKSLTLCNFKGEKERTTNFNADVTTITGGNGMGKSRHFDAFIWLLFGKDTQDRKDYEVKTRIIKFFCCLKLLTFSTIPSVATGRFLRSVSQ